MFAGRIARLAVLLVLMVGAVLAIWLTPLNQYTDPVRLAAAVEDLAGLWWFPLAIVVGQTLAAVLIFPTVGFVILAGFFFGFVTGGLIAQGATTVAAVASYWSGRFLSEQGRQRLMDRYPRLRWLDGVVQRHAMLVVICGRMLPILPFAVESYGFAFFQVPFWRYLIGSFLGSFVPLWVWVYFGESLRRQATHDTGFSTLQLAISAGMVMLVFLVAMTALWLRRRGRATADTPEAPPSGTR